MNLIPSGQGMFPEGFIFWIMAHPRKHLTAINFWVLKCHLIFLASPKEIRNEQCVHTCMFQESRPLWLWATYRDPKDLLRGIINWNLFQWKLFPFISLQKQKKIIGQGNPWGFKRAYWWMTLEGVDTQSEMVNIQKALQRNSNSLPLTPSCLFDLELNKGCKLSAKLPWH